MHSLFMLFYAIYFILKAICYLIVASNLLQPFLKLTKSFFKWNQPLTGSILLRKNKARTNLFAFLKWNWKCLSPTGDGITHQFSTAERYEQH